MYSTLAEFYKSKQWRRCVELIRMDRLNDEGMNICEYCGQPIVKAYDCIGHHREPLTISNVNNPDITLSPANIQLLHHKCHNAVHDRFGLYVPQKVYIVHGAPLSGKSSFVRENKGERDIVIDIDMLWHAVTFEPMYVKNNYLKSNIFLLRNTLLDQVKVRQGLWQTAWVIGSYPSRAERERLADRLGAELIHIDTGEEECQRRLLASGDRPVAIWKGYISDYFQKFN
ncbi:MAG: HNH endonuclease [Lentihominibacter sp.]